jgi:hypothetical protein
MEMYAKFDGAPPQMLSVGQNIPEDLTQSGDLENLRWHY